MDQAENRLRALHDLDVPAPPPVEHLRQRLARRRRRWSTGVIGLLAVAGVSTALLMGPGSQPEVVTVDQPTTSTSQSSAPATGPMTTTTALPPGDGVATPLVFSGPEGVAVGPSDGPLARITDRPAAVAFGIGADLVVYQASQAPASVYPPRPGGSVALWTAGTVRDLETAPDASAVTLLDADVVGGSPVALVAERLSGGSPATTFEELVRIDLRDGSRTTIVRRPAWESGHLGARLLPDGGTIGLFAAESQVLLARWSAGVAEPMWQREVGSGDHWDLTLHEGRILVVDTGFDRLGGLEPTVRVSAHDPATGQAVSSQTFDVGDLEGVVASGLSCRAWLDKTLVCGRSDGPPVSISHDGSLTTLAGDAGSIPTVVRSAG